MTTPTASPNVLKVVSIDDLGLNIVHLPAGTFLIDGEVVEHSGFNSYNTSKQLAVKDVENILSVIKKTIPLGYRMRGTDGDVALSIAEYERTRAGLKQQMKTEMFSGMT